jgi:hypothetical protein
MYEKEILGDSGLYKIPRFKYIPAYVLIATVLYIYIYIYMIVFSLPLCNRFYKIVSIP